VIEGGGQMPPLPSPWIHHCSTHHATVDPGLITDVQQ